MMIDAKPLNQLRKGEMNAGLEKALDDSLLNDPLKMWVASGQLVFDDFVESYFNILTFVSVSLNNSSKFNVGVIADGQSFVHQKEFSYTEIKETFPHLFNFTGQIISLHS